MANDTKQAVDKFAAGEITVGQLMKMVSLLTMREEIAVVTDAILAQETELEDGADHQKNSRGHSC